MLYLALSLLTAYVYGQTDVCEDDDNWKLDYTGNSGKFKYRKCEEENFAISLTITEVAEYEPDGTKTGNKITSMTAGDWVGEEDAECDVCEGGGQSLKNSFTLEHSATGATFYMTTYLMLEEDSVQFTHTYTEEPATTGEPTTSLYTYEIFLENNTIEFMWRVENWPFESMDNYLVIAAELHAQGKASNYESDYSKDNEGGTVVKFEWGNDFELDSPYYADFCDDALDANGDCTGTVSNEELPTIGDDDLEPIDFEFKNNKVEYILRVRAFGDNGAGYMEYDPVFNHGAASTLSTIFAMVLACFALLFA